MSKAGLCFCACLVLCGAAFAEKISFTADSMTGVAGNKASKTALSGNAQVKTKDMEITADEIILDGDDFRFITATGRVTGKNTRSNLDFSCGKMTYDRSSEVARLEDTVHLVDNENSVTIDGQLVEYNQKSEIAIMQINVTLQQKDNTCTSAYAIYRKQAQMLEMSGNPKIVQGEDTFRAQEITLNLNTQEITLDGRVSGTVTDTKKSQPAASDEEAAEETEGANLVDADGDEERLPEEAADTAPDESAAREPETPKEDEK